MAEENDFQKSLIKTVRDFVKKEVLPVASVLELADEYPEYLVEQMKQLGFFGATIDEEYGGSAMGTESYALLVEELAKGWMSLTGVLNTHLLVANMIQTSGTEEQKQRFLPYMATGDRRAALCITEPEAGTDVAAIQTTAILDGDDYVLNGRKMYITNGRYSSIYAIVCKTDIDIDPMHKGISVLIGEKSQGLNVVRDIPKLGYRGVETTEITFDDYRVPRTNLLGGFEGHGFAHVMSGLELGRINVASRAVGVARAALEAAIQYSQKRETFGKPIAEHQAIQQKIAEMATRVKAAHLLVLDAAKKKDQGVRADLEAGMAKLFASETCLFVATEAMRIHGGAGYIQDLPVERYFRDAPLMIIGEGTNEIQRQVITKNIMKNYPSGDFIYES